MADFPDFLDRPADDVAELLLGCVLERTTDEGTVLARIVETEAYDEDDEASHAHGGRKQRNAVMFDGPGHLYVYFTYGMHHCCNVVCGKQGYGAGALIRAVEPIVGVELVERRRGMHGRTTTNGPGKLCQALAIDLELGGHDLRKKPLRLLAGELQPDEQITRTTRIGISKAQQRPRRFYITDNQYVSKKVKR